MRASQARTATLGGWRGAHSEYRLPKQLLKYKTEKHYQQYLQKCAVGVSRVTLLLSMQRRRNSSQGSNCPFNTFRCHPRSTGKAALNDDDFCAWARDCLSFAGQLVTLTADTSVNAARKNAMSLKNDDD
jgi:hypothetical protein